MQQSIISNTYYESAINTSVMLSPRAKTTYANSLKKIMALVKEPTIHNFLMSPDKYGKLIVDHGYTDDTLKTYMTSVLAHFAHTDLKATHRVTYNSWYKWFIIAREKIRSRDLDREPTDRMRAAHMEWEEIIKRVMKLQHNSPEYLLMCVTCMLAPRRQMDWYKVRMHMSPNEKPTTSENFIHLGWDKEYHINLTNFKTSSTYGTWRKKLPTNLFKVLIDSMKREPREYLFVTSKGMAYASTEAFAKWSNKVIKETLNNPLASMNMLRHSFASYINRINPNMTGRERAIMANAMGHSIIQNIGYDFVSRSNNFKDATTFTDMPRHS
jgi:hypothetical protein